MQPEKYIPYYSQMQHIRKTAATFCKASTGEYHAIAQITLGIYTQG